MSYASKDDIIGEFRGLKVTADSVITEAKILRFIEEAEAYINSRLASVYIVPVTSPEALPILRNISIYIVVQRIKNILSDTGQLGPEGKEIPYNTNKEANRMLAEYLPKEGKLLPDIILPNAEMVKSGPVSGAVSSTFTTSSDRIFTKKGADW